MGLCVESITEGLVDAREILDDLQGRLERAIIKLEEIEVTIESE